MNNKPQNTSEIDLIFQDDHLLIINKPPNLLSVPDGYNPDLPHLRSVLAATYGPLWMVHRLDRGDPGKNGKISSGSQYAF